MSEFDANKFENNISKNYSIAASAGTGKTHSMVEMVKKLVKIVDIEKILIVTYTEKAAGELKTRIKEELPNIDIDKAHIGTIHSFCKDTITEFSTIMGLPSGLNVVSDDKMQDLYERYIREILYNNKIDKGYIISNTNKNNIQDDIKKMASILYLDKTGKMVDSVINFKSDYSYDLFKLDLNKRLAVFKDANASDIDNFFKTCGSIETGNNDSNIKYQELEREYSLILKDINDDIKYLNCLEFAKTSLSAKEKKENDKRIKEIETKYEKIGKLHDSITDSTSKKGEFVFDKRTGKPLYNYPEIAAELNLIFTLNNMTADETVIYKPFAIEFYNRWQEEKRRNKWFTFNDMLREVREAVLDSSTHLVEKLREKYTYALIDEFQDTNQLQWDIFKEIFLNSDKNHIIVVGDRKQSIYSFQGADLTVYDNAVKEILNNDGIELELPKNFRSSPSMVSAYNKLFQMNSFNSLNYSPVIAGKDDRKAEYLDENGEYKEIIGLGIVTNEGGEVSPYDFALKAVNMIADFCTKSKDDNTKLRLIDKEGGKNVTFKDFKILARTRKEFKHIENELKNAGIPYVKYKDNSLFKGIECNQWIAVINAILKPDFTGKNRNAFRKVLFTKFFGKTLEEIASPTFDRDDTPEMNLMMKWRELSSLYRYDELINSILTDSGIEIRMGNLTDIQSLNIFKQIGDYCLDYLLDNNSLFMLKNNLYNLSNGTSDDDDDSTDGSIVAKGTDFDCVELMTIHASKGLDGSIVFVVGGEKEDNNKVSPVGIYHEDELDFGGNVIGKKAFITCKKENYKKEKSEEKDRLFYVAYTRAKYLLVLPLYKKNGSVDCIKSIKELMDDPANSNLYKEYEATKVSSEHDLKEAVKNIIKNNASESDTTKEAQEEKLKEIADKMHLHNTYKHSYASMSKAGEKAIIINEMINSDKEGVEITERLKGFDESAKPFELNYDVNDIPNQIPSGFPKGAEVGTTLHEIFELFEFTDIDKENNNLDSLVEERFKENKLKLTPEHKKYVVDMVSNVLNADLLAIKGNELTGEKFALKELNKDDRKAETEFNFSTDLNSFIYSNYCNGFIDLLFRRGDVYSILDWKSDTINGEDLISYNTLKDMKVRVDGHYSIQRVLYSYCLIKWLAGIMNKDEKDIFNENFGGIYYVFIRGCKKGISNGIYSQTWESWENLKAEFELIMNEIKAGA